MDEEVQTPSCKGSESWVWNVKCGGNNKTLCTVCMIIDGNETYHADHFVT